MEYLLTV